MKMALRNDVHQTTGVADVFMHLFFHIGSHSDKKPNYIVFFDVPDNARDRPDKLFRTRWRLGLHLPWAWSITTRYSH
jgi:hypothetical protein